MVKYSCQGGCNINKVLQICLVYVMTVMTGTLYYNTHPWRVRWAALILLCGCIFLKHIEITKSTKIVCLCLAVSIAVTRWISGGVGAAALLDILCPILLIECAYELDKDEFATAYLKFAAFFAASSILFFCLAILNHNAFEALMSLIGRKYLYPNGMICCDTFLYGYIPENWVNNPRNDSIFSEPAQYSIMLNAALWILAFSWDSVKLSEKTKKVIMDIILVALVTCMSTTGYICAFVILVCALFQKENRVRKRVCAYAILAIISIMADYFARGSESILQKVILNKVFSSGKIDLSADTGRYRMSTITACFEIFLRRPFGAGYDIVNDYVDQFSLTGSGSSGGGLAMALAVYGVLSIGILAGWMFRNSKKRIIGALPKIAFWFFYIWVAFAQSNVAYPLIFVPLYAMREKSDER